MKITELKLEDYKHPVPPTQDNSHIKHESGVVLCFTCRRRVEGGICGCNTLHVDDESRMADEGCPNF